MALAGFRPDMGWQIFYGAYGIAREWKKMGSHIVAQFNNLYDDCLQVMPIMLRLLLHVRAKDSLVGPIEVNTDM